MASGHLPCTGEACSGGDTLGTDAARGDVGGLRVTSPGSWGFTHVPPWALLRISSSAWDCWNYTCCPLGILAGGERQEKIPVSTPSHSSQEQTSISSCLLISLSKTPCPAQSFANVPSLTEYQIGFHCCVPEVRVISPSHSLRGL